MKVQPVTTTAGEVFTARDSQPLAALVLKITAKPRPFILTFGAFSRAPGASLDVRHVPLTSEEAQRLLDAYPAVSANTQRVVLVGHNTPDPQQRTILRPATRGGGPAFEVTR